MNGTSRGPGLGPFLRAVVRGERGVVGDVVNDDMADGGSSSGWGWEVGGRLLSCSTGETYWWSTELIKTGRTEGSAEGWGDTKETDTTTSTIGP